MTRELIVAAAQLAPVTAAEKTADVVERLLALLQQAADQRAQFVMFPDAVLRLPAAAESNKSTETTCSPQQLFEQLTADPDIAQFVAHAKRLKTGFGIGLTEPVEPGASSSQLRCYSSGIVVGSAGELLAVHRAVHPQTPFPPGLSAEDAGDTPVKGEAGPDGFLAVRALDSVIGVLLGCDDRQPESWRMLGLQGVELALVGSSHVQNEAMSAAELFAADRFRRMSIQAGALQNGMWALVGGRRSPTGDELACGAGLIVSPAGELVAETEDLGDAVVVHACNLEDAVTGKQQAAKFAGRRQPDHYALLAAVAGPVAPRGQNLQAATDASVTSTENRDDADAAEAVPGTVSTPDDATAICELLAKQYGYSESQARAYADKALKAKALHETAAHADSDVSAPLVTRPVSTPPSPGKPAVPGKKSVPPPPPRPAKPVAKPAALAGNTAEQIEQVLGEGYGYDESAVKELASKADRAMSLQQAGDAGEPETKSTPPSAPPGKTAAVSATVGKTSSVDHMDGTLNIKRAREHVVTQLTQEYGYSKDQAEAAADKAALAAKSLVGDGEPVTSTGDEPPTRVAVPPLPVTPIPVGSDGSDAGDDGEPPPTLIGEPPPTATEEPPPTIDYANEEENRSTIEDVARMEVMNEEPAGDAATQDPATPTDRVLLLQCPKCDFPMKIPESQLHLLGHKARCPQCRVKFRLPELPK